MKSLSILFAALLSTTALAAPPSVEGLELPPPVCRTCNPLSGENHCDVTTSCINTGTRFHCACRAGYKASRRNLDINEQFRLNVPGYRHLVFTPPNTQCDTLCRDPFGASDQLCSEVPLYRVCPV